jgi:hypothetical protein
MDAAQTNADPQPTDRPRPGGYSTAQVLLGVFVCGQIVYLLVANFLNLLSDTQRITQNETPGLIVDHLSGGLSEGRGHWNDVYSLARRWEQVGNCNQSWRMFSPNVGDWYSFVRVEMRWDGSAPGEPAAPGALPVVMLKAMDEPEDMYNYRRWGPWRFTRYEDSLMALNLRVADDEDEPKANARWKKVIRNKVDAQWDTISAYFNWRWHRYKQTNADAPPPQQMILLVHAYWISPPGDEYGKLNGPTVVPIARCEFGKSKIGTSAAIQAWDPETRRWTNRE